MNNDAMVYESLLRLASRLEHGDIGMPAICEWVGMDTGMPVGPIQQVLFPQFQTWEKFSGNLHYPVNSDFKSCPEELFYRVHITEGDYWDITTEYGANRRELLIHLIHHLLIKIHADMEPRAELRFPL